LILASVAVVAVAALAMVRFLSQESQLGSSGPQASLPAGVTLRQIDGGQHYYANISQGSAWMDQHVLLGVWLEEPMTKAEVQYDVAMGNNIYWNLASSPLDSKDCDGQPCRVDFNLIRAEGMHDSAPDVTANSGSETVQYSGADEPDMIYGPGSGDWNPDGPDTPTACIPSGSKCGYTVAKFYYTGQPSAYGPVGYPIGKRAIAQGFGKGVLFWEANSQAAKFLYYSDTLSADSYWMSDPSLDQPGQGGCALFSRGSVPCLHGDGRGLTVAQRRLTANYAFNVSRIRFLESLIHANKPIVVDVETGCPFRGGTGCSTPAASISAAWHALIAGARGIVWFQDNFGGNCPGYNTFYAGSNPKSPEYNCLQTPGVTLHDVVRNVSAFNHDVADLNGVLLSPFMENYVNVATADVSVMAKDSRGAYYVFAASGKPGQPPKSNQRVIFKLAGGYRGPVHVIDENRTLQAVDGVFTDVFSNGYSVHIYKIG
jgi:hypothetical protein